MVETPKSKVVFFLVTLLCGILISAGLVFSGIANPQHSLALFSIPLWNDPNSAFGGFDITLPLLFFFALAPNVLTYHLITNFQKSPIFGSSFGIPTRRDITFRLVFGALLFGIGWGMCGLCPGPALLSGFSGHISGFLSVLGLLLGWTVFHHSDSGSFSFSVILRALLFFGGYSLLFVLGDATESYSAVSWAWGDNEAIFRVVLSGLLIASSVTIYLSANGLILGISGTIGTMLSPAPSAYAPHKIFFIAGFIISGLVARFFFPAFLAINVELPWWRSFFGSFLAGIGTSLSNGCTSGHGICGVSRFSPRSITATAVFFCTAIVTGALLSLFSNII